MWALFLKVIYSVILFSVLLVIAHELLIIWLDKRVYIGRFEIVSNGDSESTESTAFAQKIVASQAVLAQQLQNYQSIAEPSSPTDATYTLSEKQTISVPPEALKDVEITIQNVNLTAIFTALRKGFTSPNEVRGHVTSANGSVLAAVDWPRAPVPKVIDGKAEKKFYISSQPTLSAVAANIACSVSWARGAAESDKLAEIPRSQSCDFAMSLNYLYEIGEKAHQPNGLNESEVMQIRRKGDILAAHYGDKNFLPDIYRLRADLIDLLPENSRTLRDLVQAQEDRLSYSMLAPNIVKLPEGEKRFTVLALARPAIKMDNGRPVTPPENWKSILDRYKENILASSMSTGLVLIKSKYGSEKDINGMSPIGTAFIVAPNLAITASHVIDQAKSKDSVDLETDISICFTDVMEECKDPLKITKVHFKSDVGDNDIALVEVDDHSPVYHPPLPIAEPNPLQNTLVGSYAYVVGYPFADHRLPEPYLNVLFGSSATTQSDPPEIRVGEKAPSTTPPLRGGQRRLMPGRLLAFNPKIGRFTSDISTTGGTSGAALVNLSTGEVLGVSLAGQWKGERGKFSYSSPIPKDVRELIQHRLAEQPLFSDSENLE